MKVELPLTVLLNKVSNGLAKFYTEQDCDWSRCTFGDSQESPGIVLLFTLGG